MYVPEVIGAAKNLTDILDRWKCFITDPLIESMIEDTNKYINSVRRSNSRSRDGPDTDGAEIKSLLGLLYLAAAYHGI